MAAGAHKNTQPDSVSTRAGVSHLIVVRCYNHEFTSNHHISVAAFGLSEACASHAVKTSPLTQLLLPRSYYLPRPTASSTLEAHTLPVDLHTVSGTTGQHSAVLCGGAATVAPCAPSELHKRTGR